MRSDLIRHICNHAGFCCLMSGRLLPVCSLCCLFFLSVFFVDSVLRSSWMLQLLQYHVVPGMAMTTSTLTDGLTLTTALTGQTLKV